MKEKIPLMWLKDIPEPHRTKFKEDLGHFKNGPIFERLKKILSEEEGKISNQRLSVDSFDQPNWPHKQAFVNGQLSILRLIKELIS